MHLWWGWGGELLLDSASMRSSDLSDSNNRIKNTNTNWIQSIFKPAYFGRLPLCWQYEYSSIQIGVLQHTNTSWIQSILKPAYFGRLPPCWQYEYSSIQIWVLKHTTMSIAAYKYEYSSTQIQIEFSNLHTLVDFLHADRGKISRAEYSSIVH